MNDPQDVLSLLPVTSLMCTSHVATGPNGQFVAVLKPRTFTTSMARSEVIGSAAGACTTNIADRDAASNAMSAVSVEYSMFISGKLSNIEIPLKTVQFLYFVVIVISLVIGEPSVWTLPIPARKSQFQPHDQIRCYNEKSSQHGGNGHEQCIE